MIDFKIWIENKHDIWICAVHVYGYTYGSHFEPEYPASDSRLAARWEWMIKNDETFELLRGQTAFIFDNSWRSYHESTCDIQSYFILQDVELYNKVEEVEGEITNKCDKYVDIKFMMKHLKSSFVFEDKNQLIQMVTDVMNQKDTDIVGPEQSSEDYWKKQIDSATSGRPPRPTGWDGD